MYMFVLREFARVRCSDVVRYSAGERKVLVAHVTLGFPSPPC
jgi:hypothetical protein